MTERTLSHFALLRFREGYWTLAEDERSRVLNEWWQAMQGVADRAYLYQVFPSRSDGDLLLWTAKPAAEADAVATFFLAYDQAFAPWRRYLDVTLTLWGLTKPSIYSRGKSPQEINPFVDERKTYLIVYPFVKTADWYLLSRDARQGMMNEHIRVGHQYPEIKQLLLYSFGLQDQEFVVVYETDDVAQFSDLVQDLRSTEARRYTLRDTPIITAVRRPHPSPRPNP